MYHGWVNKYYYRDLFINSQKTQRPWHFEGAFVFVFYFSTSFSISFCIRFLILLSQTRNEDNILKRVKTSSERFKGIAIAMWIGGFGIGDCDSNAKRFSFLFIIRWRLRFFDCCSWLRPRPLLPPLPLSIKKFAQQMNINKRIESRDLQHARFMSWEALARDLQAKMKKKSS